MVVGLISDTHGLVRPEVFAALEGVQLILHAGDVGAGVLEQLEAIAPVRAVAGNTDDPWDPRLGRSVNLEVDGVSVHVSHGHELGLPKPDALLARYEELWRARIDRLDLLLAAPPQTDSIVHPPTEGE